ncbi:MAG: class I SAM-dependent methyltransferase [Acidimicrobiia bacterium]|nr:class I SAM-dependent methyltransferase [Acidimicrobiia bacterium]MDX2468901.1 class I SAM-dependent methyltransferase [Acidimicrobiia bacterium]
MDHFQQIYANEADTYHRLVAAEDAHGELAAQLDRVAAAAISIVDIGTGTGRLAIPLCQAGKDVHGVDTAAAMLEVAASKLDGCPGDWTLSVGDARQLPIADAWADAAIAGWVFGHFTEWRPETWEADLDQAIAEMDRVVKDGGLEVVIDTLGTAAPEPAAPTPGLAAYHQRLEEMGFERTVLRTDYRFASVAESVELLEWFFGLGDWGRHHNDMLVPEFTGWWERRR